MSLKQEIISEVYLRTSNFGLPTSIFRPNRNIYTNLKT